MKTLFDSSILIAHLRGESRATELLTSVETGDRLASVLSRTEIEGALRSTERAQVARLFSVLTLLPVTDLIAGRAAESLRRFRESHPGLELVDCLVAATAELYGARLATLDVSRFPMLQGRRSHW